MHPALKATLFKGVGGPFPAPTGYRWQYMVVNGERQTLNGDTLVLLERAA